MAVKILRASLSHAAMESAAAEIIRELNTMRRVGNHRHIVSLLGICHLQFPARLAIVTDYMARGSLLDVLKGKTGDPPSALPDPPGSARRVAGCGRVAVGWQCEWLWVRGSLLLGSSVCASTELTCHNNPPTCDWTRLCLSTCS